MTMKLGSNAQVSLGHTHDHRCKGEKGDQGEQGIQGIQGEQGCKGEKGDKGQEGLPGTPGPVGDTGDTGQQGIQGDKGDKGDKGDQGPQGELGPKEILCCKKIVKDGQELVFIRIRCENSDPIDLIFPCANADDLLIIECDE